MEKLDIGTLDSERTFVISTGSLKVEKKSLYHGPTEKKGASHNKPDDLHTKLHVCKQRYQET